MTEPVRVGWVAGKRHVTGGHSESGCGFGLQLQDPRWKNFLKKIHGGQWEDNNERSFYEYVNSLTTSVTLATNKTLSINTRS